MKGTDSSQMDDKLLEFWSNFFFSAFKNRRRIGDIYSWMQQEMNRYSFPDHNKPNDFEEMMSLFRKMYGIDQISAQGDEYNRLTQKAMKDLQSSYKEFMSLAGAVPIQDYLDLVRKYEKLKEKCRDQEETIKHLRLLADEKNDTEKISGANVHEAVKEQSSFFLNMMQEFTKMLNGDKISKPDSTPPSEDIPNQLEKNDTLLK